MIVDLVLQKDVLANQSRDGIEDNQENTTTGSETHDLWCESIRMAKIRKTPLVSDCPVQR
jgi:hypothetical protein